MKILNSSYGNLTLHQGFCRFSCYRLLRLLGYQLKARERRTLSLIFSLSVESRRLVGLVVLGSWLFLNGCSFLPNLLNLPTTGTPAASGYRVAVQQVLNGNTVEVIGLEAIGQSPRADLQDQRVRVRLIGIDAPALAQTPWGEESKQYLQQILDRSSSSPSPRPPHPTPVLEFLELDTQERDQYDRFLGYLWRDQSLINEEIAREGQGLVNSRFPNIRYESRLESAQQEARLLGVGIWNPDRPLRQSPAEFWQENKGNTSQAGS